MLDLREVSVGFRADADVLSDINLCLEAGSTTMVTGAGGSGKSTLLAVAAGLIPKLIRPHHMQGAVALDGTDLGAISGSELFRRVGLVLQSVEDQVWDLSVEDLIAFPLENRGVPRAEIRARVAGVIEQMNIGRLIGRTVRTLSGGERRIAALASALVWQPDVLILDEPTSGIDPDARLRMIGILRELRKTKLTLLIAEQDLAWFDGVADRVVFLKEGRIIDDLPWQAAARATAPYAVAGIEPPFAPPLPRAVVPLVQSGAALSVRQLSSTLRRPNGEPVLRSIDLALGKGEVAALIGSNGAGKTTLMRTLLGLQKAAGGTIEINGHDSAGWTIARRAGQIGYVAQNLRRMFFLLSVVEEVVFSLSGGDAGAKAVAAHRDRAIELLKGVGLADRAELSPFALSAREQLMLALVCIEATAPSVVILDEPLIACDSVSRAGVLAFLDRCRTRGCAALLVSHDLQLVDCAADRVLILEDGRLAFDGTTEVAWSSDVFARRGWPRPDHHVGTIGGGQRASA
ncbi:ATP-binding cassette domain-containing protein [Bradyrhizobium sp. BRP22]|uniref:ABC transporter ATP-binding protein n=1 Tax=Bradyrhizobium sp. BRP22 TaxID=2793821 RepID=UPI001CD6030E|nr:ATP-binding cassette domain-containing protein [Bradyrhizobium sp. BRP22]MCA1453412.1 ATP-binding cassette domain-containing protein [Bradyrhizobium sp. BRP22]